MCYQETETVAGYTSGLIDTLWPFVLVLILSFVFWLYRNKIRDSKARKTIPYVLLVVMLIFEIKLFVTLFSSPFVPLCDTLTHLPLHLCSTSAVLVLVYLFTRKESVMQILFFQGIAGALVTFVFPSISSFPYEYDYWRFFLSHSMLYLVPIYFFIVEDFRVTRKTLIRGLIAAHIIAAVAVVVNLIIDHDYMYLTPDNTRNLYAFIPLHEGIPFMGNWPMVILFGEVMVFPVYFALYGLFKWLGKVLDKNKLVEVTE